MRRALFSLQVFLLMCTPLPQFSYGAVGFGRTVGLSMALILGLYVLSDLAAFLAVRWLARRLGQPGLVHLQRRLPRRLVRRVEPTVARAAQAERGGLTLPALFVAGYVNLYLAALVAGLSRVRLLPAMAFAVAGDLLQFAGTLALAGLLARSLPFRGAEWVTLLTVPVLLGLVPAGMCAARGLVRHLRRPRPAFLPPVWSPALVPVPVYAEERRPR